MADNRDSKDVEVYDPSRRSFIMNTSRAAGGFVGGSLLGGAFSSQAAQAEPNESSEPSDPDKPNFQEARQFFTRSDDFAVLGAATECVFPEDDNGPGSIGLNVPYYIDKQLAGLWGVNARDYRAGPFHSRTGRDIENSRPHPDQLALNRCAVFINGLRKLNETSEKRFDTRFERASEEQQIQVLRDFEHDHVEIEMDGVAPSDFFSLLRQATLEGAYSDPLYGGNKNMQGWKMKEYPGSQPSYLPFIEQDEFAKLEPISLMDYQG